MKDRQKAKIESELILLDGPFFAALSHFFAQFAFVMYNELNASFAF